MFNPTVQHNCSNINYQLETTLNLESIFVEENQIPQEFLIQEVNQREFLSNGEMKAWEGELHTVNSPVCVQTPEGLKRKLIGTYPVCSQAEAMESLDAAVLAYNNGRGAWPTMSVQERIYAWKISLIKCLKRKTLW